MRAGGAASENVGMASSFSEMGEDTLTVQAAAT